MSLKTKLPRNPNDFNNKKIDKTTVKRLFAELKDYRLLLIIVAICTVLNALAGVASSISIQIIIDDYINPMLTTGNSLFAELVKVMIIMAIIYIIGVLASLTSGRVMVYISQGVLRNIRNKMFSHMQSLPVKYFDSHPHGDIMSHYTNDTDTLRQMISQSIPQVFSATMTFVFVLATMLATSVYLTIFVAFTLFCIMTIVKKFASKSSDYFKGQQRSLGELNGYIEEMISGQKVVKVFCHEEKSKKTFDEKNLDLNNNVKTANKIANVIMPMTMNLGNLQYILLAIFGGFLAINGVGGITIGTIAAFLHLSKSIMMPFAQVSQQMNSIILAFAGAGRIFKLIDEEVEIDNGVVTMVKCTQENSVIVENDSKDAFYAWKVPTEDGFRYEKVVGAITFNDVDFGYDEKLVLKNINLYADPKHKIAFVGATGAGKTTITNLINRFYDIADGKVQYDGININTIKKADLRKSLGMVLQETNLFTATVMENIRFGRLDATDEECINATKLTNADKFIKLLPDGYDTVLTAGGAGLSQGQRQLLAIARAAVANPPVMILDEATSSIDTRTELIVQKGMDALMHNRTVFVIAHRLSTIQNADVIMVMEGGKIIERGNHERLLSEKGRYYKLFTNSKGSVDESMTEI